MSHSTTAHQGLNGSTAPLAPGRTEPAAAPTSAITPAPDAGKGSVDGPDLTIPADGSIPAFLDRVGGRSAKEVAAEMAKVRKKHTEPTKADRLRAARESKASMAAAKTANLTDDDKAAIAELKKNGAKAGSLGVSPFDLNKAGAPLKAATTETTMSKKTKTKKPARTKAPAKTNGEGPRAGSKTELVAGMLKRKDGCTGAEVLKATGWPTVSMPAQAKAAGLKLRKEKAKGEPTRYFGS
jgi:Protein of unknown function (DUF3489)